MTDPQTVLLTGATGKLGRSIVARLLGDGHTVVATSRRAEALFDLAGARTGPGRIEGIVANLCDGGGAALASQLASRGIRPHAIVNNAVDLDNQKLASGRPTIEQWRREFDLAVIAPYELTTALAEQSDSQLRTVVNVSSIYGIVARNPNLYDDPVLESPIHYGIAKAAMIHLTRELAVRLAPKAIRINAVTYGGVEGRASPEFKARYGRLSPSGRMLADDEVAGSIAFLISNDSSSIVGHNLVVDGGWTLW